MSVESSTFRPRPAQFLGITTVGCWRVKRFALAVAADGPRPQVIEAATAFTASTLDTTTVPPPSTTVGGVPAWAAFMIIHDARPACFLQINQWRDVDLVQHYFTSPLDTPHNWQRVTDAAIGCVWELAVLAGERDAWVHHVLTQPSPRGLDRYLHDRGAAALAPPPRRP